MKNETKKCEVVAVATPPQKEKKHSKNFVTKVIGITVIHVIAGATIVGLSMALAYSRQSMVMQMRYQQQMNSAYSRSYNNLVDGANDMDVKMRKLGVAATNEKQQSLLYEVWGSACLAENNLATFESDDNGLRKAEKFVNQLGDYAHYLALKLADGETLSAEERVTISKLGDMVGVLKKSLSTVQTGLDSGRLFVADGGVLGDFSEAFKEFTSPSIEYPEMIYDGPFSDALETRKPKALVGADISEKAGVDMLNKLFKDRKIAAVEYQGETTGDIETLNFNFTLGGNQAFAQIAKKGGMLVSFNMASNIVDGAKSSEGLVSAVNFMQTLGYHNFEVVWSASANGMKYVNLAPVENNTIIYPDLIKVKVDEASGEVIGFDAMHYVYNHTVRNLPSPVLSLAEARS
ncbi:MAG: germination protein YpeB, partial [Clostridia bacterium]